MEATTNEAKWVPVLLVATADGYTPTTGLAYNATGLAVSYKRPGQAVESLALTANNWREAQLGAYEALLPIGAFDTLGTLLYWCEATDAVTYPGAIEVRTQADFDEGPVPWTVTVNKFTGEADAGAQVWLTSDEAGANRVRNPKNTDDAGQAVFHVDVGVTYWIQGVGSDGEELVATSFVGAE